MPAVEPSGVLLRAPGPEVRFQEDLSAFLSSVPERRSCALLVRGPQGCGQSSAAAWLASLRSEDGAVVRLNPGEMRGSTASRAVELMRERWSEAAGGVLVLGPVSELVSLPEAPLVLDVLRRLIADDRSPSLIIFGDRESVADLRGVSPLLLESLHVRDVAALGPSAMASLAAPMLSMSGFPVGPDVMALLESAFSRAVQPGDLVNSRFVRAVVKAMLRAKDEGSPGPREAIESAFAPFIVSESSSALDDLERLIGIEPVKDQVRRMARNAALSHRRRALGLDVSGMGQHMVFAGPAGTAKTTVARIVARILRDVGVIRSGHLVEVQRADLVGHSSAETARKIVDKVHRSFGGVLFLDEAYTLTSAKDRSAGDDQGREALETLMKMMEDYRDEFVVIAAGYPAEMDAFLNSNPGLRSRFSHNLLFPEYSVSELLEIVRFQASERGYVIEESALELMRGHLEVSRHYPGFGNGRYVRTLLESAIARQGGRLTLESTDDDLRTLSYDDFEPSTSAGHRFGIA